MNLERTVIALGFFDGVHRGHGALLQKTVQRAGELGAIPAVFTFDRPPKEVVTGRPMPLINSPEDRADLARRIYGIQQVILAPFDEAMMTMPWQDFITELLVKRHGAVHLVAGHDYHFGYKNQGDPRLLQEKCRELGIGCDIIPKVELEGVTVSSTYIRTLVDMAGVLILTVQHEQLREAALHSELSAMDAVLHRQYEQYRQSKENIRLINRRYHELKMQIAAIRAERDQAKQNAALAEMESDIRRYEAENKTGNPVLDTLLTAKSLYCQQHGITLTCVADGAALDFMDTMDLCSLFGNALDNAIESVEKLPDSEQRLIHLVVARQKGFLWIRVENTYDGAFQADGNLPKTTKSDARYHGYGLKSIYDTAEKYGGTAEITTQENQFTLKVLFPIKQK